MYKLCYYFLASFLVLCISSRTFAQDAPAPVHSYTFEDGTPDDVVGWANGWLVGGAEIVDGSLVITQNGQWMQLPADLIGINGFEEVTIEMVYTPSAGANTGFTMLAFFGDTNPDNSLGVNYYFMSTARGDDVSRTAISIGEMSQPWAAESGANGPEFDDGERHHMVSVLTASDIALFIDGEETGRTELAEHNVISGISIAAAYLARGGYTVDPSWIGSIHEFHIYDRALTESEIRGRFEGIGTSIDPFLLPELTRVSYAYPNPFTSSTTINYEVGVASEVRIVVYDVLGREVAVLVDEYKAPGTYTLGFDSGELAGGTYFYTMDAGANRETRSLFLAR